MLRQVSVVTRIITELLLVLWGVRPDTEPPPRVLMER
jgi:hypothetical protein